MSHPARGAWIEISFLPAYCRAGAGRTPQGVRGLKFRGCVPYIFLMRRTPQGVRGLKFNHVADAGLDGVSHPARGAWIEICVAMRTYRATLSHPARGAWIEIYAQAQLINGTQSHPARGAWIEMQSSRSRFEDRFCRTPQGVRGLKSAVPRAARKDMPVAPRKGCVD